MKTSIRSSRFTTGMVLFLGIILLLSVSSAFYLNRLSGKTNAILKENHYSVVYAQDMSEVLANINQGIIKCLLSKIRPDSVTIGKNFLLFNKSLELEKNNITEPGEDELVSAIDTDYNEYQESVLKFIKSPDNAGEALDTQTKYDKLYQKLILLSLMNEKAIEEKTNDAKVYVKKATYQMTFIGTMCFLIAYGFTFIFSSYFNERFYRLYKGIKELNSVNYSQKLYLDGNDELFEISEIFNEMSLKINDNKQEMSVTLQKDSGKDYNSGTIHELKNILGRIESLEEETKKIISRFEKR